MQIESIIENNKKINSMIQRIIELRRAQRIPFEKNGEMDKNIKAILEMETKKCLALYKIEFLEYQCQGAEGITFVNQKNTADCYGGIDGLQVTKGMQKFIDEIIIPTMKEKGYSVDENGTVYFNSNITSNLYHEPNYSLNYTNDYVGSTRDQMDYFATLFAKNGVDMDWVLDVLPHEEMHTFGVTGGNAFLKEGITEELTREICEKYGLHMTPTSHSQEAEFVRKLEIIVGRDEVIKSGMWTGKFKEKHFKEILETNPEMKFEDLSEIFEILKYDPKKLDKDAKSKEKLEEFSEKYPEIVSKLKEKVDLYRQEDTTERYAGVAKKFDERLGLEEGTFFKYVEILDNFYQLNMNHKQDTKIYRDLYSLSIEELKENYYKGSSNDEKKLYDTDKDILDRIQSLFKELSKNNMEINSFEDLMNHINEYVKDKELDINTESKDYTDVLDIQKIEIEMLQEIESIIAEQVEDRNSQYLYHHTRVADLKSILETGLEARNGVQSKAVNDPKIKVFFSEGIEGTIAMASDFQKTFDKLKMGTDWEDKTLEDFLEERVFLRFSPEGIINESDYGEYAFADGWTSQGIEPEKLKVCLLRNIITGEISYERDDILKYMLATTPVESFKNGDEKFKKSIKRYYESRRKEIAEFKVSEYSLEDMELDKFYEQYIARRKEPITQSTTLSKESLFSPREIGKATVNTPTESKDIARSQVQRDEQILQQEQERKDGTIKK